MDIYQQLPEDTLILTQPSQVAGRRSVRSVLLADAVLGIGSGAALVIAGGWLAAAADLESATLLRAIGLFLLVYGAGLAWSSRQPAAVARRAAIVTGVGDLVWIAASVLVAFVVPLPMWATGVVVVQAVVVAVMASAKRHVTR